MSIADTIAAVPPGGSLKDIHIDTYAGEVQIGRYIAPEASAVLADKDTAADAWQLQRDAILWGA